MRHEPCLLARLHRFVWPRIFCFVVKQLVFNAEVDIEIFNSACRLALNIGLWVGLILAYASRDVNSALALTRFVFVFQFSVRFVAIVHIQGTISFIFNNDFVLKRLFNIVSFPNDLIALCQFRIALGSNTVPETPWMFSSIFSTRMGLC